MINSILPFYLVIVFGFSIGIVRRAAVRGTTSRRETRAVDFLLGTLFIWTLVCTAMGLKGLHTSPALLTALPFLWQAVVPVLILAIGLLCLPGLGRALGKIALATPLLWLVWVQALRIGAAGGIIKGLRGEITSSYVFWVGIPDLLYGISALLLGVLLLFRTVGRRTLLTWHLLGPAIILLPTFGFMPFFMNEPGFGFILAFPMVLAPGIVVPLLLFLNLLAAWKLSPLPGRRARDGMLLTEPPATPGDVGRSDAI